MFVKLQTALPINLKIEKGTYDVYVRKIVMERKLE
jgi:hypothetical protein